MTFITLKKFKQMNLMIHMSLQESGKPKSLSTPGLWRLNPQEISRRDCLSASSTLCPVGSSTQCLGVGCEILFVKLLIFILWKLFTEACQFNKQFSICL